MHPVAPKHQRQALQDVHMLSVHAAPQDVVGIDCGLRGWRLALRLLAPGSLLAALRLYSFGFALGALRVCQIINKIPTAMIKAPVAILLRNV